MLGKKNLSSQNSLCLRCSCSPCQMLLYLEPGWQNVLACWSPRWAAGSQRGFCLSVMWWSGAAKVYSAILVCAAESCFFGVIDSVAEAWMHVMWTSKPQSTAGSWNKILQHVYLEHMGSNRSWSLDSWNPCFFLLWKKCLFYSIRKPWTVDFSSENSSHFHFIVPISCALQLLMRNTHGYFLTCCENY